MRTTSHPTPAPADTDNSNLPPWPGAAAVYSRAYRILETMGRNGGVEITKRGRRTQCLPREDMRDLILALNEGDEERIKGLIHRHLDLDPLLARQQ